MTNQQHIAAGIDLGSNTFRLLVADCATEVPLMLTKKLATVGLARGLKETGLLQKNSMLTGFAVLRTFRDILDQYRPYSIRVCGTEALRQAENSHLFLQEAENILHQPIDIIKGEEEARLSLAGVLSGFKEPFSGQLLLVDTGGGSTELVSAASGTGEIRTTSVGLGVVWLTEMFFSEQSFNPSELDRLLVEILQSSLENLDLLQKKQAISIIGCGGTATSMAALHQGLSSYNGSLVHGYILNKAAIKKIWSRLIRLPGVKRNQLPCLGQGRGEILPAGMRIYYLLLQLLRQDRLQVSDTGLLEGIMYSSLHPNGCFADSAQKFDT